jgi:hypothetical protein
MGRYYRYWEAVADTCQLGCGCTLKERRNRRSIPKIRGRVRHFMLMTVNVWTFVAVELVHIFTWTFTVEPPWLSGGLHGAVSCQDVTISY